MTLDQRLTQAMQHVADEVIVPQVDVAAVRSTARAHRIRVASVAATAAAALVLVAATALVGGRDTSAPEPANTTPVPEPSLAMPSTPTFKSSLYDLTVRYPVGWIPYAATQKWSWQANVKDWKGPAQDHILAPEGSPTGDIRVSAWAAPIDPATRKESTAYLVAFAEDFCEKSGNSPCTGIADRAVELCVEKRDCHPGLLVPFKEDVQAFFSGGNYPTDAMTIVAVWRPEWDNSVRRYGGARKLLESFLATMDVWPSRPAPTVSAMPLQSGALAPGTYAMTKPSGSVADYERLLVTLPAGWATSDGLVHKRLGQAGELALSQWAVNAVYDDPCHWRGSSTSGLDLGDSVVHQALHEADRGSSVAKPLKGGLANQSGRNASGLTSVELGGQRALKIELSVPSQLDLATCDEGEFRSWAGWGAGSDVNTHHAPGQVDVVYLVDVDRTALVIDASHGPAATQSDLAELEAVLASMVVDRGP